MGLAQAANSIARIFANRRLAKLPALRRYAVWQLRRIGGSFPAEVPLSESVLVAPSGDCGVSALVNIHGMHDYNNMMLVKALLRVGGAFVDVGANVGAYTLVASEQADARVLAIEPHPATLAALKRNVERNGRGNVTLVQAAAGAVDGSVRIIDTPGSSTTHIIDQPTGIEVPLRRLDSLLDASALHPAVIKIDVEGYELDVLRGLGRFLGEVPVLLVEINELGEARGTRRSELLDLLAGAGYSGPWYCDYDAQRLVGEVVHVGEDPLFILGAPQTSQSACLPLTDLAACKSPAVHACGTG